MAAASKQSRQVKVACGFYRTFQPAKATLIAGCDGTGMLASVWRQRCPGGRRWQGAQCMALLLYIQSSCSVTNLESQQLLPLLDLSLAVQCANPQTLLTFHKYMNRCSCDAGQLRGDSRSGSGACSEAAPPARRDLATGRLARGEEVFRRTHSEQNMGVCRGHRRRRADCSWAKDVAHPARHHRVVRILVRNVTNGACAVHINVMHNLLGFRVCGCAQGQFQWAAGDTRSGQTRQWLCTLLYSGDLITNHSSKANSALTFAG